MAVGDKIKCTIVPETIRHYNDEWMSGIVVASVKEVQEGKPVLSRFGEITLKGNMPKPKVGEPYHLTATEVEDPKYGKQYNVEIMSGIFNFDTNDTSGQRKFLSTLFTEKQVQAMYDALPNPFESFNQGKLGDLVQIKGCGMTNAVKWLDKFNQTLPLSKIYIELEDYGLTNNMINRLLKQYKSADLVIQKVKNNPYMLCEVDGIGWLKADQIAMAGGIGEFSTNRIKAFILHYLEQEGMKGDSYVSCDELMGAIIATMGDEVPDLAISTSIHELGDKLWYNDTKDKMGLRKYRNLEESIGKHLIRLMKSDNSFKYDGWEDAVRHKEHQQGWNYTEQQILGIKTVLENQVTMITGGAGCVDCDTEFFNGKEWKKISDYEETDMVLQYHEEGYADLVKPSKYHKYPADELTLIESQRGSINQCLSDDHMVYYKTDKGKTYKKPFHEIRKIHEESTNGFSGKFLTTFDYEGKGMELSEFEIRLMVAVIADGHFPNKTNRCRVSLLKDKKKERLEWILNSLGLGYDVKVCDTGYSVYHFQAPRREKQYTSDWYNCNKQQFEIICDEVLRWDGNIGNNRARFSTAIKETADFVQFAFTSIGKRTTILVEDRVGKPYMTNGSQYIRKSIDYTVQIAQGNPEVSLSNRHTKNELVPYKTKDGYKYCFTVDTHLLVLRRNNRIFITGNCGKSSIVAGMLAVLKGYSFAQCALAGRAAARLTEVTHQEGYTIHRLLAYPTIDEEGKMGFGHNEKNPLLQDIIIVDEISMVDGFLFLNLIRAIKDGAKLILLGDIGQLESIGCCNVAYDIINSGVIPVVQLTQIHRQAQSSAVVTESRKIREGTPIIPRDWVGVETRGELQDMVIDCYSDKSNTFYKVMQYFSTELENIDNIMDIQIIVPQKDRGGACTWNLNNAVQELYNPAEKGKEEIDVFYGKGKVGVLRIGDKVINTKNNYKTMLYDPDYEPTKEDFDNIEEGYEIVGQKTPIYNGSMGIVTEIDKKKGQIIVSFTDIGEIVIPRDHVKHIELGYANTCHKMQGSEAKIVIVGIDFDSYQSLNREWLYTAPTRAKQLCYLVAQNSALLYGISQSGVSTKMTHLVEVLNELMNPKLVF